MTQGQLSQDIRNDMIHQINELDLPDFLVDEVSNILNSLNYYKLINLQQNFDGFIDFLINLNQGYEQDMDNLFFLENKNKNGKTKTNTRAGICPIVG